ncbi:hypothetical protein BP5796_03360 [Coleophoma crateriformis]|uniref:Major facilitator superfamily (MFS) profile domain-containing protein n=1 Tax=Coleophoma crateriformis TaxID=565419 RepID=A0A3D8SN02_9HELO|nr:hypothetical protein BP5796_03360 [Coleophoma crateriformis]
MTSSSSLVEKASISGAPPPPQGDVTFLPPENESADFKPTKAFMVAFASLAVISPAAALDAISLSIALPIVTEELGGTAIEAFWSGTSFLVTSAVFHITIPGLGHVIGRKQLLLCSELFFAVSSLVAVVAKNMTMSYLIL